MTLNNESRRIWNEYVESYRPKADRSVLTAFKLLNERFIGLGCAVVYPIDLAFRRELKPKMEGFFDLSDLRFLNADWKSPQTVAGLVYLGKKYDEPIGQWSVTFKKRIGPSYGEIARSQTERKSEMVRGQLGTSGEKCSGRGLYRVYAVDPKTEEILLDGVLIVAGNADEAKFDTLNAIDYKGKLGSLDVRVECVMGLRARAEVQEVKIVKDE